MLYGSLLGNEASDLPSDARRTEYGSLATTAVDGNDEHNTAGSTFVSPLRARRLLADTSSTPGPPQRTAMFPPRKAGSPRVLSVSLLRALCIILVVGYHFHDRNEQGRTLVMAPFTALLALPGLALVGGYLEARSHRTSLQHRLLHLAAFFGLCVVANAFCVDWPREWSRAEARWSRAEADDLQFSGGAGGVAAGERGGNRASLLRTEEGGHGSSRIGAWCRTAGHVLARNTPVLVYHGGFVFLLMVFTCVVRPFRLFLRGGSASTESPNHDVLTEGSMLAAYATFVAQVQALVSVFRNQRIHANIYAL